MDSSINQTLELCKKILKENQKFIISADLDGILSALVLQKYLNSNRKFIHFTMGNRQ